MAAGLSAAIAWKPLLRPHHHHHHNKHQSFNPHTPTPASFFRTHQKPATIKFTACVLMEDPKKTASSHVAESEKDEEETVVVYPQLVPPRVAERLARKKSERLTYLITAMMSSFGITSMAVFAVYYRFAWQFQGGEIPLSEMFGTFALSVGAAVGMEFWARWAHRALWHASLWHMHESHHRPRDGPFELNDVFAIINAVPAIALLSFGFFHKGLVPGLCFGANIVVIHDRRGGRRGKMYHGEWLDTLDSEPDVISMILLPLTTLLRSIRGSGFVSHAINLYLRYKPPTEDLHQFFEFQLPRQWAPVLSEIRLGSHWRHQVNTWLRFSIFGPKLYINTIPVDVGNRPVIGLRLQLEGRRSNRLAIHLQHLASLPKSFPLSDNANAYLSCDSYSCSNHKKVKWNCFSYVCTAPVESDDSLSMVTGAQLQVEKKCLLLRLRFSKVIGATLQKPPQWDQSSNIGYFSRKYGGILAFISKEGQKGRPKPGDKTIGSNTYSAARPAPVHTPKLQRFVDTTEMIRGPEDTPGYWVVSGARLSVQNGKIYLLVKYSLLSFVVQCETQASEQCFI